MRFPGTFHYVLNEISWNFHRHVGYEIWLKIGLVQRLLLLRKLVTCETWDTRRKHFRYKTPSQFRPW